MLQVHDQLGEGSFATVHKAVEIATGRVVALKVVRPESELDLDPPEVEGGVSYDDVLGAMRKEKDILQRMGPHPNVVELIGAISFRVTKT